MGAGGRGVSRSGRQGRQGDGRIRSGRGRESFITRTDSFTFHHNDRHSEPSHPLSPLPPSLSLLPTWSLARPFPRLIVPWDRHFTCPPISSTRITKWIMMPRRRLQPIVPSSWERGKDFPVLVQAEEKGPTRCTRSVSKKESAGSKSWFLSLHFYAAWFGPGHYTCIFQTTMSSGIAPPLVHNRLWNLSREDLPSAGRPDSQPTRPVTPQVQNTII